MRTLIALTLALIVLLGASTAGASFCFTTVTSLPNGDIVMCMTCCYRGGVCQTTCF